MAAPSEYPQETRQETRQGARQVVSKVEARQAVTGHNVRYVLGVGLAAVVIAFLAIWLVYFG